MNLFKKKKDYAEEHFYDFRNRFWREEQIKQFFIETQSRFPTYEEFKEWCIIKRHKQLEWLKKQSTTDNGEGK